MSNQRGACLVCGKPLKYFEKGREMECSICHRKYNNTASCEDGHYVCDDCHSREGIRVIEEMVKKTDSCSPVEIMQEVMQNPYIYMHGPEHHVLVGAAILTAYKNSGGEINYEEALEEMIRRGRQVPGGICGFWGCCGAAVSTGIAYSILSGASPLSGRSFGSANQMTARALQAIGEHGGPRCCKRDSFLAATEAVKTIHRETGIQMELPDRIFCGFHEENEQCLRKGCPFYPVK